LPATALLLFADRSKAKARCGSHRPAAAAGGARAAGIRACQGPRRAMKVVVAPLEEFPPNSRRIVRVGSREIGVFRVDDRFYAVRNRCPHQGAPLCVGRVFSRIVSERPGEYALDSGPPLLVCPWHGWQYDVESGQSYSPGDPRVKSYGVSVASGSELAEGPYVVETYTVTVAEQYVVLEV
jgi:3-phenylpropionate/trans-cinnamate dioxygenase ferredoxin subunit